MPTAIKTPLLIGLSLLASLSLNLQAKPNYSAIAKQSTTPEKPLVFDKHLMATTYSISVEPSLGIPNFIWLKPSANTHLSIAKLAGKNLEDIARGHIAQYAKLYRLNTASLSSAHLQDQQRLGDSALIRFNQIINGIEVFERHISVLMDKQLALTAISGYLAPQQTVNKAVASTAFKLSLPEAISSALADLSDQAPAASAFQLSEQRGDYQWYVIADGAQAMLKLKLSQAVRGKKVYFPLDAQLEPAYYLEITTTNDDNSKAENAYSYVISAQDGRLLARTDLTAHDAEPFSYRVWAEEATLHLPDDSPYGNDLTPFPDTAPTQAAKPIAAKLIQLSCGPISTCDPWLPNTAVQTVGNNVDAYADISRGDGFSRHDIRAPLSADHTFDYSYDFSEYDSDNRPGQLYPVIVQAFYTTNFLHDWLYDHGFNEQAGNGQDQNYGRGGAEVDRMKVEINDFSGTDNANMATPADGASARMQLFLWSHNGAKYLAINSSDGQRKKYPVTTASFGPQDFKLKNQALAIIDDGTETTSDGCEASVTVSGKIAIIDRGSCFFAEKVKNAQDAGAIAAIIVNNVPGKMLNMGGTGDPTIDNAITIPTLGITKTHGDAIKQQLTSTPTLTANLLRRILPPYNSALDNTIVVHEWGHFLSTRLVKRLANNQGRSMGEGWSDFLSLLVMVRPEDQHQNHNNQFNGAYPVAQYVSASQPKDYFFGIRRYPYSTDMAINPLTFKHITDGVALPTDIPTLFTASLNSEVHNSGEVWASMLWEAYAQLLNDSSRLNPEQARDRMLDYLVASLKMTPANPTFIEARDALLAVAQAHDSDDYKAFWRAFAKRGLGINAKAPKRYSIDHLGAVEDYQVP